MLETRLGVRLLTRTTRSVSPTEAGEHLMQSVAPKLAEIESELAVVSDFGDRPMGTIRITAIDHVVDTVIWPRLANVLDRYPDIRVEINTEYRMMDIAAERFDIGVRYGDQLHQDMIAVRPDGRGAYEDRRLCAVPRSERRTDIRPMICCSTTASRCAWRAEAACMPGSCDMKGARSKPAYRAR